MNPLTEALDLAGLTQAELAAAIGVTPQAVSQWIDRGRVPAERCIAVEIATGGQVTRYELRPDVFGDAPREAA